MQGEPLYIITLNNSNILHCIREVSDKICTVSRVKNWAWNIICLLHFLRDIQDSESCRAGQYESIYHKLSTNWKWSCDMTQSAAVGCATQLSCCNPVKWQQAVHCCTLSCSITWTVHQNGTHFIFRFILICSTTFMGVKNKV
jgi:hypothetical protein